jgi:DTW domain-containing protein YfiP
MSQPAKDPASPLPPEACAQCDKAPELCICSSIVPRQTALHVVVLQHPQEPDKELGSARLAHLALPNSTLKVGLSWPNLKKATGREDAQSSRWAVLYLGSGIKGKPASGTPLTFVSKSGAPIDAPSDGLDGIVILDGTWSQAKTLWWRNAWLLKLKRVVLTPQYKSLYRELRKEPRRECLSTIESIAECLTALGESAEVEKSLKKLFGELLDKQRARLKARRERSQPKAAANAEAVQA